MAYEVTMPRLGWTMEEGVFGEWLKQDGDEVKAGDLLFTVEGDKATQEVEVFESGILRLPQGAPAPGDVIPVGALLAYIVQAGELMPAAGSLSPQSEGRDERAGAASPAGKAEPGFRKPSTTQSVAADGRGNPTISPRARRVAGELGVDWTQLTGSGRTGRIVERDVRAAAETVVEPVGVDMSPVARRMAAEADVSLEELTAIRPGGRIQREDVEAAIAARRPAVQAGEAPSQIVSHSRIRQITAQRMAESAHTTAPVTLTTEADATELAALREQLKSSYSRRGLAVPSYNDIYLKLMAAALQEHPALNASWSDDGLILHGGIHIGFAVETEKGLLAPVLRDVSAKSLRVIAAETASLIEGARQERLGHEAMQGGTFTITNLGMYGIDAFTPIINLPQAAILGIGRIVCKPAVHDGEVVPRQMVALSMTFDHRVVDGAPAARFLNTVREYVSEPILWLTS
ncbi:MAG: 2-oxo acid dehydrogenase subunit E2 [Caldilineaceae bacterium SB0661_bin_32]|uniref:Dihydrolipoamide acetyltransferase component of pyruvate dehydrogenase complex n=1 Tax=Caldilineaceae bacterium SB0661_bin_32 TaxID=2605255 RepID=A0A6B1D8N0_9CHLR|nr:2-oxo acid dehydrogenase subunit E2 [Caldilineaceae bacterium SB0661_bin_32]